MIHLHLAIYRGDAQLIKFFTTVDLCEYLKELNQFNCIWLATDDGESGEIIITENIDILIEVIEKSIFNLTWESPKNFYVQEYQTYEDAYAVALSMREGNPKCYN